MGDRNAYVSYAHADYKLIRSDILSLAQRYSIQLDKSRLVEGDRFDAEIANNIQKASAFILFLTMNYGDSDYCLKEIKTAKEFGIPICVIYKDSVENIQASVHGREILTLVDDLHQIMEDNGRTIGDELLAFARKQKLTEWDCMEGNYECYFPKYDAVFAKPEQSLIKYAYNYETSNKQYLSLIGRDEELKELRRFVESPDKLWCMITGPGGSGKSRLCLEFATVVHENEWDVYYLDDNIEPEDAHMNRLEKLKRKPSNDRLIIIDYEIARSNNVSDFIHYLNTHHDASFKTKVILVERDMSENSTIQEGGRASDIAKYLIFMKRYSDEMAASRYGPLPLISLKALPAESLQEIMRQYAEKAEHKTMDRRTAESLQRKLSGHVDPHAQRPLYAIFMTEAWAKGDDPENWKRGEALEYVLGREKRIWLDKASIPKNPYDEEEFANAMIAISARATFNGDIPLERLMKEDPENVQCIAKHMPSRKSTGFIDYLKEIGWYIRRGGVKHVAAFRPDLLGEYIVLKYMSANKHCTASLFTNGWYLNPDITTFLVGLYLDFKDELLRYDEFWECLLEPEFTSEEAECIAYSQLLSRFMDGSHFSMSRRIIGKLEQLLECTFSPKWRCMILIIIANEYRRMGEMGNAIDHYQAVSSMIKTMEGIV